MFGGGSSAELRHRTSVGVIGLTTFLVLVYIGSGDLSVWHTRTPTSLPPLGGGVVSGVFVATAASAAVVTWHRHAGARQGWIVATGALVASQSMVVTLAGVERSVPNGAFAHTLLLVLATAGLLVVVRPLIGLHRWRYVLDDGFAIGLGAGLIAAGHALLQLPLPSQQSRAVDVVLGVVLGTHLCAVALVVCQRVLARPLAWLLVGTVLVVDVGQVVHTGAVDVPGLLPVTSLARAAAGAAWLTIAWVTLLRSIREDRRRINTFEQAFVTTTRDQRERLHELRSTVAGLANGSAMMDRPGVSDETRQRLWASVRSELARMDRLLAAQDGDATDIDLDEALDLILDLQRLKGRHVEFHSNGNVVRARFDALAEVVNILLDNAATHGGGDSSLVEVVRHDEASVDILVTDFGRGIPRDQRQTIFDWGKRGCDSPGQGIGLNLAQRLMHEDGGSLRLAEDRGVGSSFVINLPAPRRPSTVPTGTEG